MGTGQLLGGDRGDAAGSCEGGGVSNQRGLDAHAAGGCRGGRKQEMQRQRAPTLLAPPRSQESTITYGRAAWLGGWMGWVGRTLQLGRVQVLKFADV